MKYLRKFETEADKDAWLAGDEFVTPNVVLTGDVVGYNLEIDYSLLPLHIQAIEDLTVEFSNNYEYSKDNTTWSSGTADTTISASAGEKVYFRASGLTPSSSSGIGSFYVSGGTCNVAGNVMSMAYGADFIGKTDIVKVYQFFKLFRNNSKIIDASKTILPATKLGTHCYASMFESCTKLVAAPELPATKLVPNCYQAMFKWCFFLVSAPELPATALVTNCYSSMFDNCSKLIYIKAMFTTKPSNSYTNGWVSSVSSTGTFVKNAAATWEVTGNNGIPEGWTVETASA